MTERQLTFIDVDENRFELRLKPDRIQLTVIDSRPELEAGELRRFASVIFTEYVGRELVARLAAAREALHAAHDRFAGGAIDDALRAIDSAVAAATVPAAISAGMELEAEVEPEPEPEPAPEPTALAPRVLTGCQPYQSLRPIRRGKRAREASAPGWSRRSPATTP